MKHIEPVLDCQSTTIMQLLHSLRSVLCRKKWIENYHCPDKVDTWSNMTVVYNI
jgi:hypothetical protein